MMDFLNYVVNGVLLGQLYALLALGFVVIYRASKVFNFAQGELMLCGAFTLWTFTLGAGLPPIVGVPLAFLVSIAYGFAIERLFFSRLIGESLFSMVMVTIGLVILIRGVILVIWGPMDRQFPSLLPTQPVILGDFILPTSLLMGAGFTLVLATGLWWFFNRSRFGLTLTAVAEDQKQALIEVAKAGDKEGFVELAEEIIAKHAKEKEALKTELDDARDQAEDLAASKKSVEKDLAEARKQARQFANATPDEQAETLRTKLQKKTLELEAVMTGELRDSVEELVKHGDEASLDQRAWVKAQLGLMLDRLQNLAARAGVELVAQADTPSWLNANAIPSTSTEAVQ